MSKEDLDQTLIPKSDDEQWRKVLHGELAVTEDDDTKVDAAAIRNYLIARDEAIALKRIVEVDDLNTISEEEARIFYHKASEEIRSRGKSTWVEFLKTYGVAGLIGGLSVAVLFLTLSKNSNFLSPPDQTVNDQLNYSDYQIIEQKQTTGNLPNMLLVEGGTISMGCTPGWDDVPGGCRPSEFPSHTVSVGHFEMSQHEVTVGQFANFVEQTQYATDAEKQGRGCVHKDTKECLS